MFCSEVWLVVVQKLKDMMEEIETSILAFKNQQREMSVKLKKF